MMRKQYDMRLEGAPNGKAYRALLFKEDLCRIISICLSIWIISKDEPEGHANDRHLHANLGPYGSPEVLSEAAYVISKPY